MRKFLHWMLSAILICGTSVFASCNNDDNPVDDPSTKKVDLATLTADYTAQDGDILIGILANPVKITVADGASITIVDAYINDKGTVYNELEYAGITCLGDATITLNDSNSICGFNKYYPAIFVPDGHTLTFQGNGILSAHGSGGNPYIYIPWCAAIGSVRAGEKCGNLVFMGGKFYVNGGYDSSAIGASNYSDCGDITIGGTAEIEAHSENGAAAIGTGSAGWGYSTCGDITIGGSAKVLAVGGKNSPAIGAGLFGKCGNITIGEEARVNAIGIDYSPGIGAGHYGTCKAITIKGGYVRATGDDGSPGIGTFCSDRSYCESITITGGTIVATGGEDAPAIGWAPENLKTFPITITSTIRALIATRGSDSADYIGAGADSTPGGVTIDGVENATPESTFPYLESSVGGNTWTLISKFPSF